MKMNNDLLQIVRKIKIPKRILTVGLMLSIAFAVSAVITPLIIKNFIDDVTYNNEVNSQLLYALIGLFLIQGLLNGLSTYILSLLCETMIYRLRLQLWSKILTLPLRFFNDNRPGELVSRLIGDIEEINMFLTEQVPKLLTNVVLIIGSLIALSLISFHMVLFIVIALALFLCVIVPFSKKMQTISYDFRLNVARLSAYFLRIIENIEVVKVYKTEEKEVDNGKKTLHSIFNLGMKEAKVYAFLEPLVMILSIILLTAVMGYGSYLISQETLTFGGFLAAFLILFQLFSPLRAFSSIWVSYRTAAGASVFIHSIFSFKSEVTEELAQGPKQDAVEIRNLTFSYKETPVLKKVNIELKHGEVVAVVGPSGSGKSTLLKLLLGLYSPDSGSILYNGERVSHSAFYKSKIGYIPQDSLLFDASVETNVFYGNETKSSDAFLTLLHQNFMNFDYESLKDEFAPNLSGGQKQRVNILRALSKEREIIYLDEPTSNLDSESEAILQKYLHRNVENKIVVIIAHRLSTIINADRIIFLDNGQVTGEGTHHTLYNTHQKYRSYVDFQVLQ
ncbi:ABC transporter ATP-binding protein [Shouchella lehensis]|uniref:ABC-type transport system ATPase component n=1 Tax=Shouchella lehensis G1 TaxID=1246626 RepID=A0A060LXQ7_9BACI|nr:ABC transporter ATP-binding protein [Shouchella lehensis]AIC96046.1 ABC-type transport system ATPase component [Shouchella lehensis G1]